MSSKPQSIDTLSAGPMLFLQCVKSCNWEGHNGLDLESVAGCFIYLIFSTNL
jgi:hypothetical protein